MVLVRARCVTLTQWGVTEHDSDTPTFFTVTLSIAFWIRRVNSPFFSSDATTTMNSVFLLLFVWSETEWTRGD